MQGGTRAKAGVGYLIGIEHVGRSIQARPRPLPYLGLGVFGAEVEVEDVVVWVRALF